MAFAAQAKEKLSDAVLYWNKPLKGRYMPFKEIAAYSFGGIGIYCIMYMWMTMQISGQNIVLANVTGIKPTHLLIIYYITTIAGIPLTALKAHLVDNLRLKSGKYRPWILGMGIPTAALCLAILYTPFGRMSRAAVYGLATFYSVALNFTYYFFNEAYENLVFLLSPNTQERADVSSIKSITYSFAPTVLNPLLPILVKILGTGDMYDPKIYQVLFPFVTIIGVALSIMVYANTNEKIVQAKTHVVQIGFIDAIKAVAKNKYFWIISIAGWIGFLESAQASILGWLYNYGHLCTDVQYSIITVVYGNASLWGMIAAPFAIRKYGKKAVLVVTNIFNILFIALMYPSVGVRSIWLVLVCLWMNALMGSFSHILTPAINADIRDYQHYITGERIDGMFSAIGLITSFITLATSTVIPVIFDRYGINDHNGYANSFDILGKNPDTLYSLINVLIILSVIGATLNVLPYFFYDLSEKKQRGMVNILKIRAMFEDYGNNSLEDEALVDGIDVMRKSAEIYENELIPVDKSAGRKAVAQARKENDEIEIARMVMDEYHKFETEEYIFKYNKALETVNSGLDGIMQASDDKIRQSKKMPSSTPAEKAIRKYCITLEKQLRSSRSAVLTKYHGNMPEFDYEIFETLFDAEDENDRKKAEVYKRIDEAKTGDEKSAAKAELKQLKAEGKKIAAQIKAATKESTRYSRAIRPYAEAEKLIKQKENYLHFADIETLYDDAVKRLEAKELAAKEEAAAEKAQKEADRLARKAEKELRKNKK